MVYGFESTFFFFFLVFSFVGYDYIMETEILGYLLTTWINATTLCFFFNLFIYIYRLGYAQYIYVAHRDIHIL
ncbi:uncharacterized protein BX664DRAFT_336284 [Halteromyces radiatus]|uniref:uncharacterized protein n=1 Tax=Halteromyces radiatus TaxID=101107 RepID=UPI00221E883A|nr:uncharacterized protein BX664DRAFT_336284 [Halteromyces radiatus]KAI8086606.1 hypothetical protein BX664DRAFT_336284 [Halteromyces radiatus]